MPNIHFFHGTDDEPLARVDETDAAPYANWYPWLAEEFRPHGYDPHIHQLPKAEKQTRGDWLRDSEGVFRTLGSDDVLVGRSMGGTHIFNAATQFDFKAKMICSVAGWVGKANLRYTYGQQAEEKADIESFVSQPVNWDRVRTAFDCGVVFYSEDDPVVDPEDGLEIWSQLAEGNRRLGGGRIPEDLGYGHFKMTEFVELRNAMFQMLGIPVPEN